MHIPTIIATLLTSAFAIPAPATSPNNHITISFPTENDDASIQARQERCDVDVCQRLWDDCWNGCVSLETGECFTAQSSPACETCEVRITGC
ncbi:uncharacterized protein LTR77_002419 [Saxophila tyrrhenica]|uniref:Uncharacterized protein n=1 Tax=Saxophila tyrrhenica TaxID=1690608 RepID=A0AAV9PNB4_9PEZI|nr:hypothetical protein LTR77_002419 [Saxophila tyrrhenica]